MQRLNTSTLLLSFFLVAGTLSSHVAHGQGRGRRIEGVRPEAHLNLGFGGTFGVGARVDIPIVDSIIDSVDDELAISPGLDVFAGSYRGRYCYGGGRDRWCESRNQGVSLIPVVAVQWNFYINEHWSVFPELGLAAVLWDGYRDGYHSDLYFRLFLGLGGRYHFNARNALLLRLGWPGGIQLGITF